MSNLKTCLKEAKNAIKAKDYEAALIFSQDALQIDEENYQALAIFGRACIEEKRFFEAKRSLLLATEIEPKTNVAWQGLSNLHEKKSSIFDPEEEISVLNFMIKITENEDKKIELYNRLAGVELWDNSVMDSLKVYEKLISALTDNEKIKEVRKSIINLLQSAEPQTKEMLEKLISNLKQILTSSTLSENFNNFKTYLELIHKLGDSERLFLEAENMASIFHSYYPLEWMAKICVESFDLDSGLTVSFINEEKICEVVSKLLKLSPNSPYGNVAHGLHCYQKKDLNNAKIFLRKGCDLLPKNIHVWLFLLEVQKLLADIGGIEVTGQHLTQVLDSFHEDKYVENSNDNMASDLKIPQKYPDIKTLQDYLYYVRIEALFRLGQDKHLNEVVNILNQIEKKDIKAYTYLIQSEIKLGILKGAQKHLDFVKENFEDETTVIKKLSASFYASNGDVQKAFDVYFKLIEQNPEDSESLFELGKLNFESKNFKECIIYLLKAAKFNPKMSQAFLYLGHYYNEIQFKDKARKCYEKALNLEPRNADAGRALSDLYRNTGKNEENLELLIRVSREGKSDWAWLRLGLQYLAMNSSDEAVKALQKSIEVQPREKVCYECLGDAYLMRGSVTAALKVFTKITEKFPDNCLYSKCQIAKINHLLKKYLASISQYEDVLAENLPSNVRTVALVGLADVLYSRAKQYSSEKLLSNMTADSLYAIKCLTSAAEGSSRNITIWKLLGDLCTLQACAPSSTEFEIPAKLFQNSENSVESTKLIGKEGVLKLGARSYGVGLNVDENNAILWHDLAINLYLQGSTKLKVFNESVLLEKNGVSGEIKEVDDNMKDFASRALNAVKKSLLIESTSFEAWNSLGIFAYFVDDLALAQHAFIQSLQLKSSAETWTNLGVLYMKEKDVNLAHEAFSQAQAADPNYVACWIGQAMVATAVEHSEAFDLYRHTTSLNIHPESCLGFASNVLKFAVLNQEKRSEIRQFLPIILDGLSAYCRENKSDVLALNMFGLAHEILGLNKTATETFKSALNIYDEESFQISTKKQELKDGFLNNLARNLLKTNQINESMETFSKIKEHDLYSQCSLALAEMKLLNHEASYKTLSDALEWYTRNEDERANVFVALAFLQYQSGNTSAVKSLLFQSPSIESRLALTALGIMEGDAMLLDAALNAVIPEQYNPAVLHHVAFLRAAQAHLLGDYQTAKRILCQAIRAYPNKSSLWRSLAKFLLWGPMAGAPKSFSKGADIAADCARVLSQAESDENYVLQDVLLKTCCLMLSTPKLKSHNKKKKMDNMELAKNLQQRKRSAAQRAVLMYPNKPETWALLISVIDSKELKTKIARKWSKNCDLELKKWFEKLL